MTTKAYDFQALQHDPESVLGKLTTDQIADILDYAADAYYNKGKPVISDDLYDIVFDYLKKKDPHHPAIQRIGAPIAPNDKVNLPYWMGSLDKIRDDPKALEKWKNEYNEPAKYVISDKLDGNSGMLVYKKDGAFLYSRGDGIYGQDVSHLIKYIHGIVPLSSLRSKKMAMPFAVRGELIISKKNWETIKSLGANARNVVAGAMHSKIPNRKIADVIDFVAYELLEPRMSPSMGLHQLKGLGFKVVDFIEKQETTLTMESLSEILIRRRRESLYEIDGIVIHHDKEHKRISGKNPKYAFAFKSLLTHDKAEVIVTKVEWNVSKNGYIKPLVHFPTVVLEGAKISKATGFNAGFIEQHQIGPGSRIMVIRSGAVIPHIVSVISSSSNGKPSMPDIPYVWTNTHVDITIKEGEESHAMRMKQIEYFAKTLDIKHLGPGTIKKLYEHGIDTIPKLLAVKKEDVMSIEGFQTTSAKNIIDALSVARNTQCLDIMAASGIFGRGVGTKKLKPVLEAHPSILDISSPLPSYEQLVSIQGIGETTAKIILDGILPFRRFLEEVKIPCKSTEQLKKTKTNMIGLNVVFTGFRNKELEKKVSDAGGKVSSAVSKTTTIVVAADVHEDSAKLKKAKVLKIPIISKTEFEQRYNL